MLRIVDQWKTDVFEHLRTALYSLRNSEDAISLFISLFDHILLFGLQF